MVPCASSACPGGVSVAQPRCLASGILWAVALVGCGVDRGADVRRTEQTPLSACVEPVAQASAPRSIVEVVALLNSMPKPISLPCFVESLERPLAVSAGSGVVSAQPATGERSPRLFLFSEPLIMTVVPEGVGSQLLEIGELRSETRSLKAELKFPIDRDLEPQEPFEATIFNESITTCAFCHAAEEPDPGIEFARAYVSQALQPLPSLRVGIDQVRAEHLACEPELEPGRCALFAAIFDWGEVLEGSFPETMGTFP